MNMLNYGRYASLSLLITVGLGSGCSQFPKITDDYQAPEIQVPDKWSVANPKPDTGLVPGPTTNLATWWLQLQDPELNRLIDMALTNNIDLKIAQSRLRQARLVREQADAGLLPSLSASTGISNNTNGTGVRTSPNATTYNANFDANWEIDIFGGIRRGIEAATAAAQASAANLDNTQVSLIAEVARNYVELRTYQLRLTIANDNLAGQTETLQLTKWRYEAGLTTSSDVEQARHNREQTRATIPDLEVGRAAAENRLAVLIGYNPGFLNEELASKQPLPELPATVALGIPSAILCQRPDIIAAERNLAAETAKVGQTLAKRFPSLNLGAMLSWQAYSLGTLVGPTIVARTLTGTLAGVLFDGGRLRMAVDIQSEAQEQALLEYKNKVLTAIEEVENALIAYAAGRERVDARREAADAARNAAKLARDLYQAGLADFQKVLDTERSRLSAEDSLALAEAGMRTNLIKLYKAMGGGWSHQS